MLPQDLDFGEFQTELFERHQRNEKALMLEIYAGGLSTRKVSAITEALCGLDVSRSQAPSLTVT